KLYADAELWLENGWLDYFVPQLYWPVSQTAQAYDTLLDYWLAQNPKGRHVWPGLFTSRIGAPTRNYEPEEIIQQIMLTRARPAAGGHVHFSMAALMENRKGISDQLKAGPYATQALVPATPWLSKETPAAPKVTTSKAAGGTRLALAGSASTAQFAVWSRYGSEWRFAVVPAAAGEWLVADDGRLGAASAVFVSSVDRLGIESERIAVLR
ncbi:MAG: family 10 glycosylhydrolase, partial [Massilia sp.]|nr:family 10 glycosylhydrolase [Massilia sp.]